MNTDSNPTLIARETLLKLAALKHPPTPDNYHKVYEKIAGNPVDSMSPAVVRVLSELAKEFPRGTTELVAYANMLERATSDKNWKKYKAALIKALNTTATSTNTLANSEAQITESIQKVSVHNNSQSYIPDQVRELLILILNGLSTMRPNDTTLMNESKLLIEKVALINEKQAFDQYVVSFKQLILKLELSNNDGIKLQQGLFGLINLLLSSTEEWLSDDKWLQQQVALLRKDLSNHIDLQTVELAEHRLKKIIHKQETIKNSLSNTRITLKKLVTSLVVNIEELSASTGDYQDKIEHYSATLNQTDDISDLHQLIEEIISDTKIMQENIRHSRHDLLAAQKEVETAQCKINQLETELLHMGDKVYEDHLTGVLNRRGLDNAFAHESSRADRQEKPLCLALLDIDNFKMLNDTYGHKVGDDVLVYLVNAIKETVRQEDVVARFGGEEFVVLLPDTDIDGAVSIISRIQHSLTNHFFTHENSRLLVTFSAGVAAYLPREEQDSIIIRADKALYSAKRNGKNQVVTA